MRILDENGNELDPRSLDYLIGYTTPETILIAHHEAKEYVPEQFHYEVTAEYPNGGKDVARVVDVPGQEAEEAWDETEVILRWRFREQPVRATEENIEEGEYFTTNSGTYRATATIPRGAEAIPYINCIETEIVNALNEVGL